MSIFQLYSGEDRTLNIRLTQKEENGTIRPFSIQAGSVITVIVPASPADLSLTSIIDNHDLGEIHVDLDDTQTTMVKSGDLIVYIQSGSITRIAKLAKAIQKLSL